MCSWCEGFGENCCLRVQSRYLRHWKQLHLVFIWRVQLLFTPWSRVLSEKLTGPQLVTKSQHFMEPEGSLPHSQQPATCPCPEPDQFSPYTIPHLHVSLDVAALLGYSLSRWMWQPCSGTACFPSFTSLRCTSASFSQGMFTGEFGKVQICRLSKKTQTLIVNTKSACLSPSDSWFASPHIQSPFSMRGPRQIYVFHERQSPTDCFWIPDQRIVRRFSLQILPQANPQLWIWLVVKKRRNRMLSRAKTFGFIVIIIIFICFYILCTVHVDSM